jgi:transcriptional regulator with XRE-family HTH domain
MSRDAAIGQYLSTIRGRADIKQGEMARLLGWSPAVLSRIESGDRPASPEELSALLSAIDTPEARSFPERLARQWAVLPEPAFDEPDADLIWEAEQAAQSVRALAAQPDIKHFFERRLSRYEEELRDAAERLSDRRYRVVLSGAIAAGKSTAICRAEGLEVVGSKGMPVPVLETGRGGVTLCEVHIRRGPGYGILIEPCSEDEVRRHVLDFARTLLDSLQAADDDEAAEGDINAAEPSREIDRVLRNMAELPVRRFARKADGTKPPNIDEARLLAERTGEIKALAIEILARMKLHRRDRRVLWHDASTEQAPLVWLQEIFRQLNNGLHPEFSLPRRIEVVVPQAPLGEEMLSVTLIDTQGIDDVAGRADLEQHFDDAHTIVALCTKFDEAPSVHIRDLLRRAKEAGVRTLESHMAVLVLARPDDALKMTENGIAVQSVEEGYDLKAYQVGRKLQSFRISDRQVLFFNAVGQEPEDLRAFLRGRMAEVRARHRETLREIVAGANALLANYEEEQALDAMRTAAKSMRTWLQNKGALKELPSRHLHDSLVDATRTAHPPSIHAAVLREGNWPKLDYGHHLSHGARRMAAQVVEPKLIGFREIATNVLEQEGLEPAHELAQQALRALEEGFDGLMRKIQLVGQSVHSDELQIDNEFWRSCSGEWGRGSRHNDRYRDRVNRRNNNWFEADRGRDADARVGAVIAEEWAKAIAAVDQLMPRD